VIASGGGGWRELIVSVSEGFDAYTGR
jgi:hypothetical protein